MMKSGSPGKDENKQMDGRKRAVIEGVTPEIDAGRFPIKRVLGEFIVVEADCFADGHDSISAHLKFKHESAKTWTEVPLKPLVNDRWIAEFEVEKLGNYFYTIEAWVDHFTTWRKDLEKRLKAGQDVSLDLLIGAILVESASTRAKAADKKELARRATLLRSKESSEKRAEAGLEPELAEMMNRNPDRQFSTTYERELRVVVDPVLASYGAWYEMFPRSCPGKKGVHGTFSDCEAHLPRISRMGFDVLYFPPIHPIGSAFRKGKNNNPAAQPGDVGSPWGIGAEDGGHKAILAELGTFKDFRRLVKKAGEHGIKIALDIAYQCSPDHPYVKEHPEWFKKRPDGTIQYAENPPKKYQDIYPIDFETADWKALWEELKSVVEFWINEGIEVLRVDNPHTKALPFWEWMIDEVKSKHPEVIFLSEAFTRPKVMYNLAKLGFTQSYNYFPWRNTKEELTEFMTELTKTEVREFYRPNLWPNTPDILTQPLQFGGRPAFMTRFILAATLGASYGIYGPAYELCENKPREAGSEEYLNSEKYEIREWNLDDPQNISDLIERINAIRKNNPALHSNDNLEFHNIPNDQIIAYTKITPDCDNIILVVVNLDPHHIQSGWLELPIEHFKIGAADAYQVHDLLTDDKYLWSGPRNYVELRPALPAHVFRLRKRVRSEKDFDNFS